jgi:hypothetical protein
MEKTISIRNTEITFSIWDLGGQREFVNMLPLVCNDAVAILFMFDLSRKSTLNSIKEWYRQARGFNKVILSTTMTDEDCNSVSSGYKIWSSCQLSKGRSRRNHKTSLLPPNDGLTTGTPIRTRHESESHFLLNKSFDQRSKGTLSELLSLS